MQAAHEDSYADNPSSSTSQKLKRRQNEDMKGAQFVVQSNLKIMARSIAALSKISEDVHIEVSEGGLFFKVFSRFKYCVFRFAPEFFNSCDLRMINKKAANICRLSMKSALRIFKGATFGEKNFVGCEFRIDPNGEKMIVNLQMNYDINRMIHVKLRELGNVLQKPVYDRALCRNTTVVFASTLIPILLQIKTDVEATMKVDEKGLTIRNFHSVDGVTMFNGSDLKSGGGKKIKTETTIGTDKLSKHKVAISVEFSFSLKEFMSIVTFADQLGSEVCLYYDLPGRPIILSIEAHPNFDIELALATMGSDDEVDLDGGIITETAAPKATTSDTTKYSQSSESQPSRREKERRETEIISSEPSSRSKRGPVQVNSQEEPSSSRSHGSRNKFMDVQENTTLPVADNNMRENDIVEERVASKTPEAVHLHAHSEEPEAIPIEENEQCPNFAMQSIRDCDPIPDADVEPMETNELADPIEQLMEHEEHLALNEEEEVFKIPEPKRRKTDENRNKKKRRILMGTQHQEAMRMSQQFTSAPLVPDTQR